MAELNNTIVRGRLSVLGSLETASLTSSSFINSTGNAYNLLMADGSLTNISSTLQTVAANSLTTSAGRTYLVQKNSSGQLVVNVPWVSVTADDVTTTYNGGTGIEVDGLVINHKNSITAGTIKGSDTSTLTFGGSFTIPSITYDSEGHINSTTTTTITLPSNPNTDTKVTQTLTTTSNTSKRPILLGVSYSDATTPSFATATNNCYASHNIYVAPSTGYLYAPKLYSGGTEVSVSGHTHSTTITSGGTATIGLEHGATYTLTAGGSSVIFSMPSDSNTDTKVSTATTTSKYYLTGTTSSSATTGTLKYRTNVYVDTSGNLYSAGTKVSVDGHTHNYIPVSWTTIEPGQIEQEKYDDGSVYIATPSIRTKTYSSSTTLGPGTAGQVIISNGTTSYWGDLSLATNDTTYSYDSGSSTLSIYTSDATTEYPDGTYTAPTIVIDTKGRITSATSNSYQSVVSKLGSTTKPVYTSANGTFAACSTYAGGTKVTLNNSAKGGSTASFYAPTAGGAAGTVLIGNGTTSAPTWLAAGTSGQVLTSNGSAAPSWQTITTSGGDGYTGGEDAYFNHVSVGYSAANSGTYDLRVLGKSYFGSDIQLAGTVYIGSGNKTLEQYILDVAGCLSADTLITMADGSQKQISEIEIGDEVLSYDLKKEELTTAIVIDTSNTAHCLNCNTYYFDDGTKLRTDNSHDIYNATKKTYVTAVDELDFDEELIKSDGTRVKFIGKQWAPHKNGEYKVYYNIITNNCCYFANDLLMANNPQLLLKWACYTRSEKTDLIKSFIESINLHADSESELTIDDDEEFTLQYFKNLQKIRFKKREMENLKQKLNETDYVSIKKSEGKEVDEEVFNKRDAWRAEYNIIEAEVEKMVEDNYWLIKNKEKYSDTIDLGQYERRSLNFFETNEKGTNLFEEFKRITKEFVKNYLNKED